jgi:N-acetylglucosamine kinase-like BadF-type ATPase
MRGSDAGKPLGPLGQRLLAAFGVHHTMDLLGKLNSTREPMEWAATANIIFEAADADPAARAVVRRAAVALGELVDSVRGSLRIDGPIVLAGGLLLNQPKLEAAVRGVLGPDCIRLEDPPVAGAVRLAELELTT